VKKEVLKKKEALGYQNPPPRIGLRDNASFVGKITVAPGGETSGLNENHKAKGLHSQKESRQQSGGVEVGGNCCFYEVLERKKKNGKRKSIECIKRAHAEKMEEGEEGGENRVTQRRPHD